MKFSYLNYCQYLLSSPKNYTITNLANHIQKISHDTINRYLRNEKLTPRSIWDNAINLIEIDEEGILVFDDTVIDKRFSQKIELVRRQYSGNEHRVIRGIGLVNCIYINPKTEEFWVIDYRIYDPDGDGKTKGVEKYKRIEELNWSSEEEEAGKLIKINQFPQNKKVQLFRVSVSTDRTEYVATNDPKKTSVEEVKKKTKQRWKIEEFHRETKQLTGLESCQCRKARIQRNHIACALLVRNYLKKIAISTEKTIYQLKSDLLFDYLSQELKSPSLKMILV